jgi:hypothetical protein
MFGFLLLSFGFANAQDTTVSNSSEAPMYITSRSAVAVPANASDDVVSHGGGVGVYLDEKNSMGLRVIYMADPPSNPLATHTPDVPSAWGPVIDWQYYFQPQRNFSFFTQSSLGYVYGVPTSENEKNVILPILEFGFGARLSRTTSNGSRIYLSPELGFVPGAVAPYSAVSLGVILPGQN